MIVQRNLGNQGRSQVMPTFKSNFFNSCLLISTHIYHSRIEKMNFFINNDLYCQTYSSRSSTGCIIAELAVVLKTGCNFPLSAALIVIQMHSR